VASVGRQVEPPVPQSNEPRHVPRYSSGMTFIRQQAPGKLQYVTEVLLCYFRVGVEFGFSH